MPLSSTHKTVCIVALLVLAAVVAAGAGLYHLMGYGKGAPMPLESYYRAVYVLQHLGGPAAEELEDIPAGVRYLDETESLLHHPDTIQVLQRVADDLAEARRSRPKAPLFEAYARLSLGERERAVSLLTRYVVENEYQARSYALLCENLYALSDYTSLLLICREWAERDATCLENRAYYLWAAMHNLGRYADAARGVAGQGRCLGWRADIYEAKSLAASGHRGQAENLVSGTLARFPEEARQIRRLWEQLRDRESV